MSEQTIPTPKEQIEQLRNEMVNTAAAGVQSMSVDGMSVQKMSSSDKKLALDEAKKATVNQFPISFFKWR